ncbi:MAG: hypothetical protein JXR78_14190 [Victivallales bacterium]|nr:hypothetical protein [Victivallales bacterium]
MNTKKIYRSRNGSFYFTFEFIEKSNYIDVFCREHPSFNGKSSNPHRTHLFHSGKLCFVSGREPRTQRRAEQLAAQWAEYFLDYRITGNVQN